MTSFRSSPSRPTGQAARAQSLSPNPVVEKSLLQERRIDDGHLEQEGRGYSPPKPLVGEQARERAALVRACVEDREEGEEDQGREGHGMPVTHVARALDEAAGKAGVQDDDVPVALIKPAGNAYRRSGRSRPLMDSFAYHPYPPSSVAAPTTTSGWPLAGLADLSRIKQAMWDAFHDTSQPTSRTACASA